MWIKEGRGSKFWLLSMGLNRVVLGEVGGRCQCGGRIFMSLEKGWKARCELVQGRGESYYW